MRKQKYMNYAVKIAKLSNFYKTRVGCIAIYKNRIISIGYNSYKTHPLQAKFNVYRNFERGRINDYQHAEINCLSHILDLNINFGKVDLYVVRILKDDSIALAKPCRACQKMIEEMGIGNVYWSE